MRTRYPHSYRGLAFVLLAAVAALGADFAPVVSWTVKTEQVMPVALQIRRGETVVLQQTWTNGGTAVNLAEATSVLLRYTGANPATNTTYHAVTGAVYNAATGVTRIRWTPAAEVAQDNLAYEVAVIGSTTTLARAYGSLRLLPGVGDSDAAYEAADFSTLDWAAVNNTNTGSAPFILDPSGEATGAVLYKGAGGWTYLNPGTSGHVLTSQGSGAAPVYAAGGAGDLTEITSTDASITVTSGTGPIPNVALPATLPARSGANLTALNASNISSGTLSVARLANGSITDAKLATTYLPANAEPADSSFGWPVVFDGTTIGKLENLSGAPNLLASDGVNPYGVYTNALPAMPGAALTTLNASALSTGTVPAARLGEQRLLCPNSGWHLEAGSSTVGWFPFVSAPVHGYCAKSAATTLQSFTMGSDPVAVPYGFAAYKTSGAVKITWTADDTDATDAKIVGITLYGATDLTGSWTSLYSDGTARNAAAAGTLQTASIDAASISALTGLRYLMAEVDCQLRSNAGGGTTARCLMIYSMEVLSQ